MRKNRFFLRFEEEEKWLAEMAGKGYELVGRRGRMGYEFRSGPPEKANIRIDYRAFRKQEDFEDYLALFEDSGWKHIAGNRRSGYQYFKRVDGGGAEDIFSDVGSRAARYKRLSEMWLSIGCAFIPVFAALVSTGAIRASALLNPAMLYLTPGLWDKTGADFWRAFLFETPFALFRGVIWLAIPLVIVLYLIFSWKARQQYRKSVRP